MRHLYRIHFEGGMITPNIEGKAALEAFLKCLNPEKIEKVLWYVSNGQWNDITKKYIK